MSTQTRLIRFYGPHQMAAWNLCHWIAGCPETALGTVVKAGEEREHGLRFNIGEGHVAVYGGRGSGWWVVEDTDQQVLPIIVTGVLGASLLVGDWWRERDIRELVNEGIEL